MESEVKNIIPFTLEPTKIKYFGINLTKQAPDLYEQNYKALMKKKFLRNEINGDYFMLLGSKTQYCQDIHSYQLDPYIQNNPNQNPMKLFCGYQQTDSKDGMDRPRTQKKQHRM